ncbi:hypothetical protein PCANC_15867 [Puccinia coronata f. sp. avenae]|uniref:Uncharacterized protein n=1 Tax=Puccinia coronata f. sp. avenae TaxID=200324 RepID=A0A2N5UPL1_9BASI|nr:hypothetical protein PCANC_15867 [Puccinia coronata f. sp. avenae]
MAGQAIKHLLTRSHLQVNNLATINQKLGTLTPFGRVSVRIVIKANPENGMTATRQQTGYDGDGANLILQPNHGLDFLSHTDANHDDMLGPMEFDATFANLDVPHQVLPSLSTPPLLPGQEHLYGSSRSRRFSNQQQPTEENAAHHQPERLGIDPHCTYAGFDSAHLISAVKPESGNTSARKQKLLDGDAANLIPHPNFGAQLKRPT